MAQATTDRVRLSYVREAVFKTTPATPVLRLLRTKSQNLAGSPKTVESELLTSTREVTDYVLVGKDVAGDMAGEMIYDEYEEQLASGFANEWAGGSRRFNAYGAQITGVTTTQYTVASVAGQAFAVGMLVSATGFTNAGNNRVVRAAATSSATTVIMTGGTTEASPPATARVQQIGLEGASGDIESDAAGLISTALDLTTLGLSVGQWVYVPGTADTFATNVTHAFGTNPGGWMRIASISASAIIASELPAGWAVDDGSGKTIRVYFAKFLKNGVTRISHTVVREYLDADVATTQERFIGSIVNKITVSAKPQAIMEIGFNVLSAEHVATETPIIGATQVTVSSADVMNTSSNVAELKEGGTSILTGPNFVLGIDFEINNNVRQGPGIGTLNYVTVNLGTFQVSGKVETYFASLALLTKLLTQVNTSLSMAVIDGDKNGLLYDFPNVKYGSGSPAVPSRNEDVKVSLDWRALRHPTLGFTGSVSQFEAIGA